MLTITTKRITAKKLREIVQSAIEDASLDQIKLLEENEIERGFDATVIIAVAGSIGTVVGALVTSLLKILESKSSRTIILQSSSGAKLEIPTNMPKKEVKWYIDKIMEMDVKKITID
jgi:hypothetical protein